MYDKIAKHLTGGGCGQGNAILVINMWAQQQLGFENAGWSWNKSKYIGICEWPHSYCAPGNERKPCVTQPLEWESIKATLSWCVGYQTSRAEPDCATCAHTVLKGKGHREHTNQIKSQAFLRRQSQIIIKKRLTLDTARRGQRGCKAFACLYMLRWFSALSGWCT